VRGSAKEVDASSHRDRQESNGAVAVILQTLKRWSF
jgi:hypothetical protein